MTYNHSASSADPSTFLSPKHTRPVGKGMGFLMNWLNVVFWCGGELATVAFG